MSFFTIGARDGRKVMKIVQISAVPAADHNTNTGCFVLCDDGTFLFYDLSGGWTVLEQLPDIIRPIHPTMMAEKDTGE